MEVHRLFFKCCNFSQVVNDMGNTVGSGTGRNITLSSNNSADKKHSHAFSSNPNYDLICLLRFYNKPPL